MPLQDRIFFVRQDLATQPLQSNNTNYITIGQLVVKVSHTIQGLRKICNADHLV